MNRWNGLLTGIMLVLLLMPTMATNITISIEIRESYAEGETVDFNYTIESDENTEITYRPFVDCPTAPLGLLEEITATIGPSNPYSGTYNYLTIEDFIEPQTCTAWIEITSPVYLKEEKTFDINTKPSFELQVNTCKNADCTEQAKVFIAGETIYLRFESEAENPAIEATLEFPDETTEEITLPHSLEAGILGTYNLTVKATKEGFKEMEKTIQFGVIEKEPEIAEVKEMEFALKACGDADCTVEMEEFTLGQTAHIDYDSEEEGIEVTALVVYPDESERSITLPASIELKQAGYYVIEATAKKEGFEDRVEIIAIQALDTTPPAPAGIDLGIPIEYLIIAIVAVIAVIAFVFLRKGNREEEVEL